MATVEVTAPSSEGNALARPSLIKRTVALWRLRAAIFYVKRVRLPLARRRLLNAGGRP